METRNCYFLIIVLCCCLVFSAAIFPQDQSIIPANSVLKDSTFFDANIDHETIRTQVLTRLPFRSSAEEYYGLFSGTAVQEFRGEENVHLRGSRHDEIDYTFEGVDTRSAFSGRNLIPFIPEALAQVDLHKSPGVAMGNAVGQLAHYLRSGAGRTEFTFHAETDRFTSTNNAALNSYSYGYSNFLLLGKGRPFSDKLNFFIAGENENFSDHYRKFWDGFSVGGEDFPLIDNFSNESLQDIAGTDFITVLPGNIANANSHRYTVNGHITANLGNLTLRAVGAYNRLNQQLNETPIRDLFNQEHIPESHQTAGFLSFQADYHVTPNIDLHLQADFLRSDTETYDPVFQDDLFRYNDNLSPLNFYNFSFNRPGEVITPYIKSQEDYVGISGYIRKKLGSHQLMIGGKWQRRTLRYYQAYSYHTYRFNAANLPIDAWSEEQQLELLRSGRVTTFGYDVFGREIEADDDINDGVRHPYTYGFYLEDRIEGERFTLNVGLRYDAFNSDALVYEDADIPGTFLPYTQLSKMKKASTFDYISPRISATYFANKNLRLYFTLGEYVQPARQQDIFNGREYLGNYGFFNTDIRGFDVAPVQTQQAVIGIWGQPQKSLSIQASYFYKSTDDHLQVESFEYTEERFDTLTSFRLNNNATTSAHGLELDLQYHGRRLKFGGNYTLSHVTGTSSFPTSNLWHAYRAEYDRNSFLFSTPLEYNQAHRLNALLSYTTADEGISFFRNSGLHLLFRANSGHNYQLFKNRVG